MNEERAVRPEHQYRTEGQIAKILQLEADETPTVIVPELDELDEEFEDE